jgi:hypothetical protein
MKSVWVVVGEYDYSNSDVRGVFSSEKIAEKFANRLRDEYYNAFAVQVAIDDEHHDYQLTTYQAQNK